VADQREAGKQACVREQPIRPRRWASQTDLAAFVQQRYRAMMREKVTRPAIPNS
jgi:hypothetical protein